MRVALAQLESRLGEVGANERRAREVLAEARAGGADLVVFPELFLTGYAVGRVTADTAVTEERVAALSDRPAAVVGFHEPGHNSAAWVEGGAVRHVHRKLYLVDYAPFHEDELYSPGLELRAFDTPAGRMAVLICNDAWQPFLPALAAHDGAELLLIPAASSTAVPEARAYWRDLTRLYARLLQCYVVFANQAGTNGGFTFWGGSHMVDPRGEIVAEAGPDETMLVADVDLAQVAARRAELPLLRSLRPELLVSELARRAA
jgi:predicted amidohydrolase